MNQARYEEAEKYIFKRLKKDLTKFYYHNLNHTKDVINAAMKLGRLEGLNEDDLLLLKTAALFHDVGFLEQYHKNEPIAVKIAKKILPDFDYNLKQIKIISDIIMATEVPHKPKTKLTHLQQIMCDADLDNLGKKDFFKKTEKFRKELGENGIVKTKEEWNKDLIPFLENHKYFTKSARNLRQARKEKHILEIKKMVGC